MNSVKQYLRYLKETLPSKPTAIDELYNFPKTLDHAFNGSTKQKEEALQRIADHMRFYFGLLQKVTIRFIEKESGPKSETIFYSDGSGNAINVTEPKPYEEIKYAGLYKVIGPDHKEIIIVNDSTFYLIHFLAVLAHEITHNYLYHHFISPPDNIDNEILTDLAAVYLGFGTIMLRGYAPSDALTCRLGYVDISTLRSAFVNSFYLRNWRYEDVINKFEWFESNKYFFELRLLPALLRKRFFDRKKDVHDDGYLKKIIIKCSECQKKIKVPDSSKKLKVICPSCSFAFFMKDGRVILDNI